MVNAILQGPSKAKFFWYFTTLTSFKILWQRILNNWMLNLTIKQQGKKFCFFSAAFFWGGERNPPPQNREYAGRALHSVQLHNRKIVIIFSLQLNSTKSSTIYLKNRYIIHPITLPMCLSFLGYEFCLAGEQYFTKCLELEQQQMTEGLAVESRRQMQPSEENQFF